MPSRWAGKIAVPHDLALPFDFQQVGTEKCKSSSMSLFANTDNRPRREHELDPLESVNRAPAIPDPAAGVKKTPTMRRSSSDRSIKAGPTDARGPSQTPKKSCAAVVMAMLALAIAGLVAAPAEAANDKYPVRPITLIIAIPGRRRGWTQ